VAGLLDEEVELAGAEEPEEPEVEAVVGAGAGAEAEPLESLDVVDAPDALSEPVEADDAAPSAAVTAGAGSLVLAVPLSPPPLLRKSVTYQPEPLS
jgi:hypothetical protein